MRNLTSKLLLLNIITMAAFAAFLLYQTYSNADERIDHLVQQQASLALQFDLSIRQYVADFIRPAMVERIRDDEFYPETMSSSYVARSIFEGVRKTFPDYIIKFSSDDPRNPLNQAGPEESEIIKMFNDQPRLTQWEGEIRIGQKEYMARFKARRMETSCIRCHGKPGDAPASLIEKYGDKAGFNKKLGDVIGLDTIAVPMSNIIAQRRSAFLKTSVFLGVGLILFFIISFLITRLLILNRLVEISKHFQDVSHENDYGQIAFIKVKGRDEISDLAVSFNTLLKRLKKSYTDLNQQVNLRTRELEKEITEHKKSEEKFRLAFHTSPNVITLTSVEDGTYVDINDAFTKLLGYAREDVIGKSALALNIWNDATDRDKLVAGLRRDGIVRNLEAKFKGKNGQMIDGIMSARILDMENKNFLLATTQDITPIKKAERDRLGLEIKLQQARKMEAIGSLAGGIAHDFNNILSGIFGYTQLAKNAAAKKNTEKATGYMDQVVAGAQRAAELVQQILTFSRQAAYKKKPLDICHEVKESLKLLRASIPASIDFNIHLDSNAIVSADPTKIHQVVMNLCTNGYHAMEKTGGTLTVLLEDIDIREPKPFPDKPVRPGRYVRLEVSDTGCGIDSETVKKVTDPYFTTKKPGQGTGLGLALVKAIIDEHEGFLDIQSELNKGSSFFIYLPAISPRTLPQKTSMETMERSVGGTDKIMVVDDEEPIRDILEDFLGEYGYEVSSFPNGRDALTAFEADPSYYDLIVTDMTMPKLSGIDLAQAVHTINPDFPVILCTGYSEHVTEKKIKKTGIKKLIQKPFDNQKLIVDIRDILDGV